MEDQDNLYREFLESKSWGILASVDLHACDADSIRNAEKIKQFISELCERIGVKCYGECQVVHFGEDPRISGYSMVQLIETSLISGHFANQTNSAYLDVFSCKYFNPKQVAVFAKEFFKADDYTLHYTLRK